MKEPIKIIVERGCVTAVYAVNKKVDVDVIDLDGDFRDEGLRKLRKLEKSTAFKEIWP